MTVAASGLDIANLVVSACIPLAIFAAGAWLAKQARDYEERQWIRRKKYDTRIERWQEMAPALNDLLCFFMCFGHFREITPPDAIKRKRQLDRAVFANPHILGPAFLEAYTRFMDLCFRPYVRAREAAHIRASIVQQRAERVEWEPSWEPLFVEDERDVSPQGDISAAYNHLLRTYDEL
jgi:hypothetical protein